MLGFQGGYLAPNLAPKAHLSCTAGLEVVAMNAFQRPIGEVLAFQSQTQFAESRHI